MGKKSDDEKSSIKEKKMEEFGVEDGAKKKGFPLHVGFILGNEFCERYSYYGMRTVLVIYLTSDLIGWDDNLATAVYHAFTVLAYLFPLVGAMVADSWWGKYWTILSLSIVYAIGSAINMMSAIKPIGGDSAAVHAALVSIGLVVIAFGTGGIKPCVSAFGGDQFTADQDDYRKSFFSLFYFAINAGSLVSTFVSPLIRDQVQCFGDDCYALAFGVPAALMFVAIFLFIVGTPYYTRLEPTGNVFLQVAKTIWRAIKQKSKLPSKERTKEHWLDYAEDGTRETAQDIQDIKYVLRVLVLYIPLPLFWSLFDQQGSRWTLQAVRMNGVMPGGSVILPDQFQICNPLIIICLIPLFEATLYRFLRKKNINFSPLKRMGLGMWLAGVAFIVAALVQGMIDVNLTKTPRSDESNFRVLNGAGCELELTGSIYNWDENPQTVSINNVTDTLESMTAPKSYSVKYKCTGDSNTETNNFKLTGEEAFDLIVYNNGGLVDGDIQLRQTSKSNSGDAYVSIANAYSSTLYADLGGDNAVAVEPGKKKVMKEIGQGSYTLKYNTSYGLTQDYRFDVLTGAAYTLLFTPDGEVQQFKDIYENDVNLFWMVPQYFIITLGEVFLSVTGLEFAYSQAPQSMKSVLQSFWLLTVSIGNIIVLIVAETSLIPSQADEYYLFAGLIAAAALLFLVLAMNYEYVDEASFNRDSDDEDDLSSTSSSNEKPPKYDYDEKEKRIKDAAYENLSFEKNTKL